MVLFLALSLLLLESSVVLGDIGTATSYNPPYTPTRCNGNRQDQFPAAAGNLLVSVSEGMWDNGAACGRRYRLSCLSGNNRPCNGDTIIHHDIFGFPAAHRRRTSADVVGGGKDMKKPILRRRKMIATSPHKSPPAHHNFPHQRRLSGTSSEHEDRRPPSPATKNGGMGGAGDDDGMTKMKEEIISSCGGKHNHGEYGVVGRRCRRWRRLIAAGTSDSPPSPSYHRH